MKNKKTEALVVSAVMIALSTVLSMIKVFDAPLGGSITLLSMLPISIVSIRYGLGWGLGSSLIYSVFQMFLSLHKILGWGLTPLTLFGCLFFDYILAYFLLGFAGLFRKKGKWGMVAGISLAIFLRFVSHFISGYFIFAYFDEWNIFGATFSGKPFLYSIVYNAFYILPELIFTVIAAFILYSIDGTRKFIFGNGQNDQI